MKRTAAKPAPKSGSLWERKRDQELVKVDHVKKGLVTYTTVYMLVVWDTPLATWHRNFRPANPTETEKSIAAEVPVSK